MIFGRKPHFKSRMYIKKKPNFLHLNIQTSNKKFINVSSLSDVFRHGFDREALSAVATLFTHSILKQLMTDGSAYVMTFTELLSLKSQENFATTLHVASVVGIVVTVFGVPYSPLAVFLYGGHLLYDNGGAVLLSLYCVYLSVMAVNGITESNAINMLFRIGYSWRHITSFLGSRTPSITTILPTFSTLVFLFFSLMATSFTHLVFGTTPGLSHTLAHVGIGGVLLVLVLAHIVSTDYVFQMLTHKLQKYAP
ncbi:unnamed protein product [Strongylus vulgaris]|uniref:Protein RFT1 homolog n=1 Tax=Strongylus vulgaris TaxID=40348 RepID=A0A3P7IVI8_STRVU|nr:unnamed protein product [Strongylus vulgaris]